jgi:sphingomyelin phosphodiesterase
VVQINKIWEDTFGETDVSMFPIQGNHDTWPVNVEDFDHKTGNKPLVEYDQLWDKYFTSEEAKQTFKDWGYYSMPFVLKNGREVENTKIIGLNCQAGNNMNWHLAHSLADPGHMLEWLEGELLAL